MYLCETWDNTVSDGFFVIFFSPQELLWIAAVFWQRRICGRPFKGHHWLLSGDRTDQRSHFITFNWSWPSTPNSVSQGTVMNLYIFLMYYFWFFSAGVSHSAPEAPKQLSSSSKAHHQIRRTMGESSTAKNPEGGRPSTKWRWVCDLWCNYCTLWEVNPKSNVWASKPMFSVVMSYIECTYF